jgi:hypothetical protein
VPGLAVDPGRRAHYADFYRYADSDGPPPGGPVAVVWGNCQAESIRVLLAGSTRFPLPTVRVPPVHELEPADMAPLGSLLPHVSILVSQPVRLNYRQLPIGTADLAASLPIGATVLRWPVVRYVGLHPFSAIVRHPRDPAADPPIVPYHDLRTLAEAAGRPPSGTTPSPQAVRSVAAASVQELARREGGTDVGVSDLLTPLGHDAVHTLNHPGNRLLIALAQRVQRALGLPADADDPGRELLGRLSAPLDASVISALELDTDPRPDWEVDGTTVGTEEIRAAHLRWYRDRPDCVAAGMRRHHERLALLGL